MNITLNDWTLIQDENKLQRGNQLIALQPLCVKALALLAENAGQVVSREALISQVWNGRIVSEDAINNCIRKIRKALDDDPKSPQQLETIPKKGYRLLSKPVDLTEEKQSTTTKTSFLRKHPYAWVASLMFLGSSLITLASSLPISMEVIEIRSDMSEAEKQAQYQKIVQRTENGGHMIKFEIAGTNRETKPKNETANQASL